MGMLKLIEWKDESTNTIVYRYDLKKDYITRGSKLTVRESQACVFCDKGRMADVFLPGYYTLDTDNVPLLTKLMSWKYGFESPFKSDVFFVNTHLIGYDDHTPEDIAVMRAKENDYLSERSAL